MRVVLPCQAHQLRVSVKEWAAVCGIVEFSHCRLEPGPVRKKESKKERELHWIQGQAAENGQRRSPPRSNVVRAEEGLMEA